jgi:hypothetical protein
MNQQVIALPRSGRRSDIPSECDETTSANDSGGKDHGDESQTIREKIDPVEGEYGDNQSLESQRGLFLSSEMSIAFRLPCPDVC